jgi:uncharacterized protein (TIGR02246 family)
MRSLLLASLLTVALGAAPARSYGQSASPSLPSVTLPPSLDRVLRDYERAWRSADADALVALFTPDGFVLQPARPPARGRAALAEVYRGQGGGPLRLRALAYATADTVGYIVGAYGYGNDPADVGKFTLTLRRARDGRWLIASDMDNGNAPPARAPVDTVGVGWRTV